MNSPLLRTVLGTIAGYAAIVVWTMLTFTLWWLVLGAGRAFEPGTTEVTTTWLAGTLPFSFVGAVLGGWVAARTGGRPASSKAVITLMIVLLGLGLFLAMGQTGAEPEMVSTPAEGLGPFEAAAAAVQPAWVAWVLPFLGAVGVGVGGIWARPADEPRP